MAKSLPLVFREMIDGIIAQKEFGSGDWKLTNKEDATELVIPKTNSDGFEVTIVANEQEVTVFTEYLAHRHFTTDGDHSQTCAIAMGLVRDLLTPNMRLRVLAVGGSPYRASLEVFHEGKWKNDGLTALFVVSWFRKKTELIYTNQRLPARAFCSG